ncbi:MAG: helix-turn-helix domain-containing protein [Thermoleophilia bacterium]
MGSVELGRRLRALRRERGLTLNDLERETGISRSFLGAVEQGRSDISISRLVRLARTYAISLDELAAEAPDDAPMVVVRAGEAPVIQGEASDVAVLLRHRGPGLTASILSHRPGSELAVEQTSFREALFHVLDGRFAATVGDEAEVDLARGDTLVYRGPVRLAVRCLDGDPGRLLSVGSAFLGPGGTDAARG